MRTYEWIIAGIYALSAIGAILTAWWAIRVYQLSKRSSFAGNVRQIIIKFKNNCGQMQDLINYELIDEIAHEVVYSKNVSEGMRAFLKSYADNSTETRNTEWKTPVTVAVNTPFLALYNSLIRENLSLAAQMSAIMPSLSRILDSVLAIFITQMRKLRSISHEEEIFGKVMEKILSNAIVPESLPEQLCLGIMGQMEKYIRKEAQNRNDSIDILGIICETINNLSDKEIRNQRNMERKMHFKDIKETPTIFDDLAEAEKGLELMLSHENLLLFRELCVSIKIRNRKE